MTEPVVLEATAGGLAGRRWTHAEPDLVVVGKEADCGLRLPSDDVHASRHHCILEIRPPRVVVRDLGSLNGTFVNDERIGSRAPTETPEQGRAHDYREVELGDGDVVRMSSTALRVSLPRQAFCPQCGQPLHELPDPDDPRCARCRAGDARGGPAPPATAPEAGAGDDDPAAVLVRLLLARDRGPRPTAPRSIPGYELGELLGRGGMGAVYLAHRVLDGAEVAVKVMLGEAPAGSAGRRQFEREIELQRRMGEHPNCVRVLDADLEGRAAYVVVELCSGGSVWDLMQSRSALSAARLPAGGRLGVREAAPIMLDALAGLAHAHAHGVIHRDLKPQNILLERGVAKLTDFGLAKDFELAGMSGMTRTAGAVGGTPVFMPREQVVHFKYMQPDTDVCGMAATFYTMLTGYFWRDFPPTRDALNVLLSEPVVPIRRRDPSLPKGLASVIDRAAGDDPEDRYPTAVEFRDALVEVL